MRCAEGDNWHNSIKKLCPIFNLTTVDMSCGIIFNDPFGLMLEDAITCSIEKLNGRVFLFYKTFLSE